MVMEFSHLIRKKIAFIAKNAKWPISLFLDRIKSKGKALLLGTWTDFFYDSSRIEETISIEGVGHKGYI